MVQAVDFCFGLSSTQCVTLIMCLSFTLYKVKSGKIHSVVF